jgi:hypothetical protein
MMLNKVPLLLLIMSVSYIIVSSKTLVKYRISRISNTSVIEIVVYDDENIISYGTVL